MGKLKDSELFPLLI